MSTFTGSTSGPNQANSTTTTTITTILPLITPKYSLEYYDRINHCLILILHCPLHKKVALCGPKDSTGIVKYQWFPYSFFSPNQTWKQTRYETMRTIFGREWSDGPHSILKCRWIELVRLQLPRSQKFINRIMYYIQINPNMNDMCERVRTINGTIHLEWYPIKDGIKGTINNLWAPIDAILSQFNSMINTNSETAMYRQPVEITLQSVFNFLPNSGQMIAPTRDDEMLLESNVTDREAERLYDDYIEHCFPCLFMSRASFECYMIMRHHLESNSDRVNSYWNAFRYDNKQCLSFQELFIGLVAINRPTPHCETRIKLIFRFYDNDQDGYLSKEEIRSMVGDLKPNMNKKEVELEADVKLLQIRRLITSRTPNTSNTPPKTGKVNNDGRTAVRKAFVGFNTFFKAITGRILQGTSKLCRSRALLVIQRDLIVSRMEQTYGRKLSFRNVITSTNQHLRCRSCVIRNQHYPYQLANHWIILNHNRQLIYVQRVSQSSSSSPTIGIELSSKVVPTSVTQHSFETQFDPNSLPNMYIKLIRDFNNSNMKGNVNEFRGLMHDMPIQQQPQFVTEIEIICQRMLRLVQMEKHVVDVQSPTYVIGDIHGNIEDLLTLENVLWPTIPFFGGNRFLFLGDYVDRGRWSFECAIYLFCLKLLAPNKITLLRGNHEVRMIQMEYSYRMELYVKFGERYGERFFELTNQVFDNLPYCAIIDERIYTAHGGIPFTGYGETLRTSMERLRKGCSPTPKENPDLIQLWEILWSDPMENKALRFQYEMIIDRRRASVKRAAANTIAMILGGGSPPMSTTTTPITMMEPTATTPTVTTPMITTTTQTRLPPVQSMNTSTPEENQLTRQFRMGYLRNQRRGTAYFFSEQAFLTFCAVNSFTHMIRGHEVPPDGFRLNFGNRCITTFSCSHYCGCNNRCAVVYVQDNRIRLVQIDTFMNNSATD